MAGYTSSSQSESHFGGNSSGNCWQQPLTVLDTTAITAMELLDNTAAGHSLDDGSVQLATANLITAITVMEPYTAPCCNILS
jgi:hypothetical protein